MTAHLVTDDPVWASIVLDPLQIGPFQRATPAADEECVLERLLGAQTSVASAPGVRPLPAWPMILRRTAPESQFDVLLRLAREGGPLPPVVVAIAGSGSGFHGSGGRPWVALEGNLHLCVLFTLGRPQSLPLPLLTPLAVNLMADVVEALPGFRGRVGIKWINDLLVDGQKVGGALAATLTQGGAVSTLLLGVGLNVAARPDVERSAHSPPAGSLGDLAASVGAPQPLVGGILADFLSRLQRALDGLFADPDGVGEEILHHYRARSLILGEEVQVVEDQTGGAQPVGHPLARGRVRAIGPGLELHLDGHPDPVTRGRILWPLTSGVARVPQSGV